MLASVVATLPGTPRLLQWIWTGCGSPSALAASVSVSRIARGVTAAAGDGVVEAGDVPLPDLPRLDPAGIHDLHRIAAGGAEQPGGVVPRAVALAALDLAQQVLVVPHEHEDPAVHAGRVVQLRVAVPREQGGHCRVERGGVAQARRSDSRW